MSKTQDPQIVRLRDVRLSFPSLFKAKAFADGQEARFGANFLLHKENDAKQIVQTNNAVEAAIAAKWPKGRPKGLKIGLHEAEEKDYEGYDEDHLFLSSSNTRRPLVVDRDPRRPLVESDGRPYAGCFVNATVRAWAQDNQFGKRVNFSLEAVQFVRDGEAFGGTRINPEEEFEDLSEDDDGGVV